MIVAFVGTIYEESRSPISGNGKTGSMTGLLMLDHYRRNKTIWTNYETDFSDKICGLQEMIDEIKDEKHENLILGISEMGQILNSLGTKNNQVLFIERFVSQIRKLHIELYWDAQRFRSIHLRLRTFTDIIYIPRKYHMDDQICNYNLCKKPHKVKLFAYKPDKGDKPRIVFDMTKVGKHYNHDEVIYDSIVLKKDGN
jgi:hypothetical protein